MLKTGIKVLKVAGCALGTGLSAICAVVYLVLGVSTMADGKISISKNDEMTDEGSAE